MSYRRGLKLTYGEKLGTGLMQKRGIVAHLMGSNPTYCRFPIVSLKMWIDPAIITNQLEIFFDADSSNPVGYITWALLAPDVEHRWINDPKVVLHDSEWNEGHNLWIMDFLALPGYCEDIVEFIEENLFAQHSQAFSLRRDAKGVVRKLSCWKRRRRRLPSS
jgi:cytolysin-activating lysine-acyltransferase